MLVRDLRPFNRDDWIIVWNGGEGLTSMGSQRLGAVWIERDRSRSEQYADEPRRVIPQLPDHLPVLVRGIHDERAAGPILPRVTPLVQYGLARRWRSGAWSWWLPWRIQSL